MPVPIICTSSHSAPSPPPCEGPGCCAGSSCYSGGTFVSMLGCDSSRGDTTCEGDHLPATKGMCKCVTGSCGANGVCLSGGPAPAPGPSPFGSLYENKDDFVVPPEDFTMAFAIIGIAGAG